MTRKQALLILPALWIAVGGLTQLSFGDFIAGDVAVLETAPSTTTSNTTASILEINPATANQAMPVSTTAIDGSGSAANPMRFSGSATSTGYLSHSADGTLLSFDGVNSSQTTGNTNTILPRGVGTLDAGQNFTLQTTYTGTSGEQPRSATSLDDTHWFIGDQGGLYTNGASASTATANLRSVKPFGGSVYALQASSNASISAVSSISSPSATSLSGLLGIANDSAAVDFYMVSSGQNGSAYDVLYILDDSSASVGQIDKFSLVSGSWVSNGNVATGAGGFGLAAEETMSGNVSLFLTTGNGASINNSLVLLTDTGGYDANIAVTSANDVTLYTASGNSILKGVDFVPVAATPEPASVGLLVMGGIAFLGRKRK